MPFAIRHRDASGDDLGGYPEPGLGVDDPAGPQPRGGGGTPGDPLPDPGPGSEVLWSLRRGAPHRGGENRQDPGPIPASERLRRAVGPHRPGGVPGLDPGARPPPPRASAPGLRPPLQPGQAHRAIDLKTPEPRPDPAPWPADGASVRTRDVLGGLIREYELAA